MDHPILKPASSEYSFAFFQGNGHVLGCLPPLFPAMVWDLNHTRLLNLRNKLRTCNYFWRRTPLRKTGWAAAAIRCLQSRAWPARTALKRVAVAPAGEWAAETAADPAPRMLGPSSCCRRPDESEGSSIPFRRIYVQLRCDLFAVNWVTYVVQQCGSQLWRQLGKSSYDFEGQDGVAVVQARAVARTRLK